MQPHRTRAPVAHSLVRKLFQEEELPLLRDHLLRLDRQSRYDRFQGFLDDSFIERYAGKCANDGTVIIAYFEDGVVRGAAELHPPDQSSESLPEIAFSVETSARRHGIGSLLFKKLISEARRKGYSSLRITTGAQNHPMRALAQKFGAKLVFRNGESSGTIDLGQPPRPNFGNVGGIPWLDAARVMINLNRAYWRLYLTAIGTARPHGDSVGSI